MALLQKPETVCRVDSLEKNEKKYKTYFGNYTFKEIKQRNMLFLVFVAYLEIKNL